MAGISSQGLTFSFGGTTMTVTFNVEGFILALGPQ